MPDLILIVIIFFFIILFMWKEAYRNKVIQHKFTYSNFPTPNSELKIFFISDIHRRLISQKIIDQVKGKANIVIIGGDLTERGVPLSRTAENLRLLNEIGPLYFVWGNNDYEVNISQFRRVLLNAGVKILENTSEKIWLPTGEFVYLTGVNDSGIEWNRIDKALAEADHDAFKIMICHNPTVYKQIKREDNVSLVLSGHTHGGQISLFGLGLYPLGKVYLNEKADLLISNGYGTTSLPLRFWARAQTHLITVTRC